MSETAVPRSTLLAGPSPSLRAGISRHWSIWREAWKAESSRPQRGLKGSEREFLPAAIEIMERPASPVGRALILTLCALFSLA